MEVAHFCLNVAISSVRNSGASDRFSGAKAPRIWRAFQGPKVLPFLPAALELSRFEPSDAGGRLTSQRPKSSSVQSLSSISIGSASGRVAQRLSAPLDSAFPWPAARRRSWRSRRFCRRSACEDGQLIAQFGAALGRFIFRGRPSRGKNDGEAQSGEFLGFVVEKLDAGFANVARGGADWQLGQVAHEEVEWTRQSSLRGFPTGPITTDQKKRNGHRKLRFA